jgi:thioredoxin reductase (NADPH)
MSTTAPGVFAAGDVTDYAGKVRLISVGFGEAATAVNNAARLIRPGTDLFPGHSTEHAA